MRRSFPMVVCVAVAAHAALSDELPNQQPNTWVKRSPLPGGPVSPGMGYEASLVWDPAHGRVIRWAGHNQGGGGEQNAETWLLDPLTAQWELREPNRSPPGVCCAQQNVFDPSGDRFLRFPAFSGSHGWQWFREIYLNNSSVWTYELETNTWRDMRPLPAPHVAPLRCASWDSNHQVAVVFGGEGSHEGTLVYDPAVNTWTRKKPAVEPDPRSAGNMAYDEAHKLHILFGAQFQDDPHTWAYDLTNNEWRDMKPAMQPPTDRNDAVLAYDRAGKVVVTVVRVADERDANGEVAAGHLETWSYDAGKNAWNKLAPPLEPPGWRNRRRILTALPELNLLLLENYINPEDNIAGAEREQQIWTYRFSATTPQPASKQSPIQLHRPRIVEDAVVSVLSATEIQLSWTPPTGEPATVYHVERAAVEVFSEDQLTRLKKDTTPLAEPSVGAIKAIGTFHRITPQPVRGTTFIDTSLDLKAPARVEGEPLFVHRFASDRIDTDGEPYRYGVYAYRIRAISASGESGPSPYFLTIPSSPQSLFSREDGERCHLRWEPNAERGIRGYRVYRIEGPKTNGPGQPVSRLTAEPIDEARYSDAAAGKETVRYHVVAVDALGQEGFPSAPTWHYRQWRRYYAPFVGEWHQ
jgi:hypothetical protein